jgi:hypothetical protein
MVERTLAEIWQEWLGEVRKTKLADKPAAEAAVYELYRVLRRPPPAVSWANSPNSIKGDHVARRMPLIGIREMLFYEAWHRLDAPETLAGPLGYSENGFRIADNYSLVWRAARPTGVPRNHPRPIWMRQLNNLLTQFNAAEMAVWEYALEERQTRLGQIGQAAKRVLHACHGMVLFTDACILLERPRAIHLDEMALLSSTTSPALEWRDRKTKLYAVNGTLLSPDSAHFLENFGQGRDLASEHYWFRLTVMRSAAERVALIELLGWDKFLELARKIPRNNLASLVTRVSQDRYGELWQVICGNQTLMLLKVVDKSPNEHGKFQSYVIPVDPRLRPLPNPRDPNGVMGPAQPMSALNAVASTFGMTGPEYEAKLGDES